MKLTIPSQDALIDPTLETQPKNLRDWVQTLPYISPANASKMARENLQKLNRIPLPIGRRLELLECSADAYWRILEAVVEHPEPQGKMAREQDPLLGLLQGFCQDLAYGYKIAVHDGQGKSSLFGRGRQQQQAVLLAIEYLGQVLNHRYALYQCPSESLWAEVDQLYRFARKRKIHLNPIAGQRGVRCSIEHAYLQVLLLKIGDPFRLPKNSLWDFSGTDTVLFRHPAAFGKHSSAGFHV